MPDPVAQDQESTPRRVVSDVTCLSCGCLCDDIVLTVHGSYITTAENACGQGREWFLADHEHGAAPDATIENRPVSVDQAIERAAQLLAEARRPIILGLTQTTLEAQAAAISLADRTGAFVLPSNASTSLPRVLAFQRIGRVSASLGEVKNRADVVVFWGVDPLTTHPRHWERYSVEPRGRLVPGGRSDRTVLVADVTKTASAALADHFLPLRKDAEFETICIVRGLIKGLSFDDSVIEAQTGIEPTTLRGSAETLRQARYGALFFGPGLGREERNDQTVEALSALVRDLNATARFVALPMGGPGNGSGIESVLAWQTGYPIAVDLSQGYPQFSLDQRDPGESFACGEFDVALIVADDLKAARSSPSLCALDRIPRILVAPSATLSDEGSGVGLATATVGVHTEGTVMRSDGVTLPLRSALKVSRPTDRDLLQRIENRVSEIQERKVAGDGGR
jgi:formylmethanofuran dehydrogenase subunit B